MTITDWVVIVLAVSNIIFASSTIYFARKSRKNIYGSVYVDEEESMMYLELNDQNTINEIKDSRVASFIVIKRK